MYEPNTESTFDGSGKRDFWHLSARCGLGQKLMKK
jgi:hypothetical protein